MRSLRSAVDKIIRRKKDDLPDIVGYVESIQPANISGWVFSRSGSPVRLTCRVNGREHAVEAIWRERGDLEEKFGVVAFRSGFQITPTATLREALSRTGLDNEDVLLLANGETLIIDADAFRQKQVPSEPLGIGIRTETLQANIESWQPFIIRGWIVTNSGERTDLEVTVNGMVLSCSVVRFERKDVEAVLAVECAEPGFEIVLPGYLWELAGVADTCEIRIQANGQVITPTPIILLRATAMKWIQQIAQLDSWRQRQFFGLLALEHIQHGGFLPGLDAATCTYLRNFAREMGLEELLQTSDGTERLSPRDAPTEDAGTLLLWKALRQLNERRVTAPEESVFAQVKAVHDEMRLAGEIRLRYFLSVVPLLCRHGDFLQLRNLIDYDELSHLDESSDAWRVSLALAAVTANGEIGRASDLLWRLSKRLNAGWINTECIRFTIEHVQLLEAEGNIDSPAAEKVRYGFIGLLDAFEGEWFSRLHDLDLVDAMVGLLTDLDRYADYQKRDLVAAAIRNYGLCPTFWQRFSARMMTIADEELFRAHAEYRKLRNAFSEWRTLPVERVDELRRTLAYFHRRGNREAVICLRELIANSLPEINHALPFAWKEMIETLLDTDPSEALRIAAFPLAEENRLQHCFPEMRGQMVHTLRRLTERDKSSLYDLQYRSAVALSSAEAAACRQDRSALLQAFVEVEKNAIALTNWNGMFLGADLLTSAYVLAASRGLETDGFLMRVGEMVRNAAKVAKADWYLPAPICVVLSRLNAMQGDAVLKSFMREMQVIIKSKFGSRHDQLFALTSRPMLVMAGKGWPKDTLVVIYSCRKYLDTRVQAIRETWVQDLKARGIPYVVLVGDGDDTLEGDLLALKVPDKYEDLPQKTLKFFNWVFWNTDAQYVVKIDDDCFLDVGRYFDTLSYRKHFYYGRVIRRDVGSTDRTWHQSKSHTLHGRKSIDRSPEPSTYADGGGGYCLSRLAIIELLRAETTEEGKRLVASSFMEDKLVGDLLALNNIQPSNEDYESYQRRRVFSEAMPVGMWENTFFPSLSTPTKVVHLDTERHLVTAWEKASDRALWPKKIWPTVAKPSIVLNSMQLELLTQTAAAIDLLRHKMAVVSVVRNEIVMLPHFLAHYRALGVKCFVLVDNCSDDGSREYLYEQPDVVLYSADAEYKYSHYGVAWQQAVLGNLCLGKWVLLADADELLVYSGCENRSLDTFLADVEAEGADAVCVEMVDMYPQGDLDQANFEKHTPFEVAAWFDRPAIVPWMLGTGWFSNVHSYVSHLRHRAVPSAAPHEFVAQKFALLRYQPWIRLSQGLHYAANMKVSEHGAWFAHFKYHAGFKDKVEIEIRRGQHFNNAAEYRRYATILAEGKGGFGQEGISVHYEGSSSFAAIPATTTRSEYTVRRGNSSSPSDDVLKTPPL